MLRITMLDSKMDAEVTAYNALARLRLGNQGTFILRYEEKDAELAEAIFNKIVPQKNEAFVFDQVLVSDGTIVVIVHGPKYRLESLRPGEVNKHPPLRVIQLFEANGMSYRLVEVDR